MKGLPKDFRYGVVEEGAVAGLAEQVVADTLLAATGPEIATWKGVYFNNIYIEKKCRKWEQTSS